MNETFQTGLHPDADQLAAFAEHALPLHEREQTLAHLAVCGDCRQIVFVAQSAMPEEMPRVAPEAARRPWFSGWNLLWPAVAALAGIVGFSVYLARVRVQDRGAQITTAVVSEPKPPPAVQVPEPLAKTEDSAEAKMASPALRAAPPPKPVPPAVIEAPKPNAVTAGRGYAIAGAAAMPQPKQPAAAAEPLRDGAGITRNAAPSRLGGIANLPVESRNPTGLESPMLQASPGGAGQAAGATASHGMPPQPAPLQSQMYMDQAKATPAAKPAAAAPAPQLAENQLKQQNYANQSSQTVNVEAANGAALALDSATLASTLATIVPDLPSHLETISSTSNGSEQVAVDSGGSVFLSRDDGKHWKSVSEAWSGRPVKVELAPSGAVVGIRAKAVTPPSAPVSADSNASATTLTGKDLDALSDNPDSARSGAQLHGVVTDPTDAAIPGAQVRVQTTGGTTSTLTQTDAAGRFQVTGMRPGKYEVTITAAGFSTLVRTVDLDARTPMGFTAVLPVGAASETVTVESASGALSKAKRTKSPGFQLTTDTGTVWVSSDGRNWKRR